MVSSFSYPATTNFYNPQFVVEFTSTFIFLACYSATLVRHQFTPNLNNSTSNAVTTNAGAGFPFNHSAWMTGAAPAQGLESSSLQSAAPVSSPHKSISIAGLHQESPHGQLQQSESNIPTSKHSSISSAFVNATSSGSGSGLHYFPPMFWPSYRAAAAAAVAAAAAATSPTGKQNFDFQRQDSIIVIVYFNGTSEDILILLQCNIQLYLTVNINLT